MTAPSSPGNLRDLTDPQRSLVALARNEVHTLDELDALLGALIPDATVPERARRYRNVLEAVGRYDMADAGMLDPAGWLGAKDPDDDSDADDRLRAALVLAWHEVTDAVLAAAPAVTVDEHAAQIINALTAPEQDERVAA